MESLLDECQSTFDKAEKKKNQGLEYKTIEILQQNVR